MSAPGITALDASAIAELMAKSRQRGVYDEQLRLFVESQAPGVQVSLTEGTFANKKAASVKTGFESARKRKDTNQNYLSGLDENAIRVIQDGENIFLVRADMAGVATSDGGATAEQTAEPAQV